MNIKELNIIKQAILNEVEGYEFYKMAAAQSTEGETRDAFLELAEEEKKHIDWIKGFFEKVQSGKEDEFTLRLIGNVDSPRIFRWEALDRDSAEKAISVFGIALQMEKASKEYYEAAAMNTELKVARDLYKQLAYWENKHYDDFYNQYEKLKEQWWADQEYAPF